MNRLALTMSTLMLAMIAGQSVAQPGRGMGVLRMDMDGDGRVSREEFRPPEDPRGRGGLVKADRDGDGAVSREEMDAALSERIGRMRERMTAMFTAMDSDGDGLVTRNEAAHHAFSRFDADGDGYISEDEARDRRRGRWPAGLADGAED